MHLSDRFGPVCRLQHVKTSTIVSEINEMVLHWNPADIPFLKKTKESRAGGILPSENNRGWTDVDSNHIKTALNQKYGIMAWARPDVQGLADRDCTGIDQSDQVRVGSPRVPGQGGGVSLRIELLPMLGVWSHARILALNLTFS